MNIDVHQLAHHLRYAPHAHLGIAPAPVQSKRPQSAILSDRTMNGFHHSLQTARQRWPTKDKFSLIGGDELAGDGEDYPGLAALLGPEQLMELDCPALQPQGDDAPSNDGDGTA